MDGDQLLVRIESPFHLSPATIGAVMAALRSEGYTNITVRQPQMEPTYFIHGTSPEDKYEDLVRRVLTLTKEDPTDADKERLTIRVFGEIGLPLPVARSERVTQEEYQGDEQSEQEREQSE